MSENEIKQETVKCDFEDSKVSCPMPITPYRYEIAIAKTQAEITGKIMYDEGFKAGQEDERAKWIIEAKSGSRKAFLSLSVEERRRILAKEAQDLVGRMADSQATEDFKMME